MVRDDLVYLAHIVDALQQISTYTEGMDNQGIIRDTSRGIIRDTSRISRLMVTDSDRKTGKCP